jgi:tetratricopeptide (TPR) repeat protein
MGLERFEEAAGIYSKMIEINPRQESVLSNLGAALIRLGRPADAKAILDFALEINSKNLHARINLGGVLQALGLQQENLLNALEAVSIDPTEPLAFNNLGSALCDLAKFPEAKHAFETSTLLDPKGVDAQVNLANIESKLGSPQASVEAYKKALSLLPPEAKQRAEAIRFYMSFEYLKQGILPEGWDCYEGGFSNLVPVAGARHPRRNFSVPRWNGESLNGKTLLVWREQGLGDELLFATCLHELEALGGNIIVECDRRLVDTFTRSFPHYTVRAEAFLPEQGMQSPYKDFDLHVPLGSLMKYFRRDIKDFERSGAYIKTDPAKVAKFAERLAPYKEDYRLVGICWRSGKLDPVRNLGYTTLDEWGEVLQTPGFKFVNLQYGECEAELKGAEEKYGVEILRWPDLNLKDDLDDVFALMHCLDAVASVQTAVLVMGGSVGVPTVGVKAGGWTTFGKFSNSPWNSKNKNVHNPDASVTGIHELGAFELVDRLLSKQSSAKSHGDLKTQLSSVQAESLQNLLNELLQGLEQNTIKKPETASVNEVFKAAAEIHYSATKPVLAQAVQSGILLKGTAGQRERAHFLLDMAATAGREGDWEVADYALQVAEDLDRQQFQHRLPEYAWLKFLDGKISDSTDLAIKALAEIDWPTAAKFHLPRLLAEGGDYDAAFDLAELVVRNTPSARGVHAAIAEAALTDSDWQRMLEAYAKEEMTASLNQHEMNLKSSALLRTQGFNAASAAVKDYCHKAQQKELGIFSALALLNMHILSADEFLTCLKTDKSSSMVNVNTFRAELVYLEIKGELAEVDKTIIGLPSFPSSQKSILYSDLCLASLIRGRFQRGCFFLSRLDNPQKNTYLIRNIIEYTKTNSEGVEEMIQTYYRKNLWFWRNVSLILDYCSHLIQGKDLCGLNSRDREYRRYADLGWIYAAIEPVNSAGPR